MANPDKKSDQRTMSGASGIRAEPADEGVILEAADVVQNENAPAPHKGLEGDRPALPPHQPDSKFINENQDEG